MIKKVKLQGGFSKTLILQIAFLFAFIVQLSESILGADRAEERKYPYQVSLRHNREHICGGSIISKMYVLTAGHCVDNSLIKRIASKITVVAGTIYQLHGGIKYSVKFAIIHEDYDYYAETEANDIAVLVTETIEFYENVIQPIKLAVELPPHGTNATLTGWGDISQPSWLIPNQLRVLTVQIISIEECMSFNPIDPNYPHELVTDAHVCVTSPVGKGIGKGDSGGGLVYNNEIIGVVSFSADKYGTHKPDICVSVPSFRKWLKQKINM